MNPSTTALEIAPILIGLLGGLALFLFGMEQMTDALKIVAGNGMKNLLAKLTTNRFTSLGAGAMVTAIIQSSSVTTVLVVGFISAGLMSLEQSIGVIIGANIGTTITAQIIAFKVTHYALVLVIVGFGIGFFSKTNRVKQYGFMVMGLGLIFFGMNLMSEATHPLRSYPPFIELMQGMTNPFLAILISAIFTSVVQSSSATTGIIIVLAGQGLISLETGIALALGANLGTCVTAMLATIGQSREALQAALVHVIFNVGGILIWIGFIGQLAELVRLISPAPTDLSEIEALAAVAPRQIANAHTLFNVINAFIFILLVKPLANLVRWLAPTKSIMETQTIFPRYLDENMLETPDLALYGVQLELKRLGNYTLQMVREAQPIVFQGSKDDLNALAKMDDNVDNLYAGIIIYLRRLSREEMLTYQSKQLSDYMAIANYAESIGDMVETNLVEAGHARLEREVQISPSTQTYLKNLHEKVYWSVDQALKAVDGYDVQLAQQVIAAKADVNHLADEAERHLARRLIVEEPNRLDAFRLESELIEYLKRVYYFAKRIAKIVDERNPQAVNLEAQAIQSKSVA